MIEPGDTKFDGLKIPDYDLEYEVLMSDKGRDGKYRYLIQRYYIVLTLKSGLLPIIKLLIRSELSMEFDDE